MYLAVMILNVNTSNNLKFLFEKIGIFEFSKIQNFVYLLCSKTKTSEIY